MTTLEPEVLLSQSDWLRGLALGLLRDPDRADDAVQEALASALERPPAIGGDIGRLRAWFSRVLRNRDVSTHRADARRAAREEAVARHDHVPAVSVGIERAELARDVVAAVLALSEDQRDVVLLRYFENLSPREIARRLGLPGTTVRARLQNGLARLRARLDRRYGDRDTWALALGALGREASRAGLASGLPLVATVVLAAAAAVFAWVRFDLLAVDPGASVVVAVPAAEVEPEFTADAPNAGASAPERRAAPPFARAAPNAEQAEAAAHATAPAIRVAARLIDETGRPLVGGRLAPAGRDELRSAPAAADGRAVLTLADARGGATWLTAWAPRRVRQIVRFEPTHAVNASEGAVHFLGDVVLGPGGAVTGRVVDEGGEPLSRVWVEACGSLASTDPEERLVFGHGAGFGGAAWSSTPRTGDDGRFRLDGLPTGTVTLVARAPGRLCDWQARVRIEAGRTAQVRDLVVPRPGVARTLAGFVFDSARRPLARTRAWLTDAEGKRLGDFGQTDEEGHFTFTAPRDRDLWLAFGASDAPWRHGPVRAGATELAVVLSEPTWITVDVRAVDGGSFDRPWLVALDAAGKRLSARTEVDATDRIRFTLPDTPFALRVGAEGARRATLGPFEPGLVPTELAVQLDRGPVVAGTVRASGRPIAGLAVALLPCREPGSIGLIEGDFHTWVARPVQREARTDSAGRFSVALEETGEFIVVARARPGVFARSEVLDVGPAGRDGLELELEATGALAGRVTTATDVEAEGLVVAASSGLGNLVTTRTDSAGNYRFDALSAGAWQVRAIPSERLAVVLSGRAQRPVQDLPEIPWDVVVEPGSTAHFDIDRSGVRPFAFRGRLAFGGLPPEGWSGIARGMDEIHPLALDADGSFRIRLAAEGQVSLSFWSPKEAGMQAFVYGRIEVDRTRPDWSLDLPVGSLDVTGLPPAAPFENVSALEEAAGPDHALVWASDDGWMWQVELDDVVGGAVRIENVPAGRIVVRHRRAADSVKQTGLWQVLAEIELRSGDDPWVQLD